MRERDVGNCMGFGRRWWEGEGEGDERRGRVKRSNIQGEGRDLKSSSFAWEYFLAYESGESVGKSPVFLFLLHESLFGLWERWVRGKSPVSPLLCSAQFPFCIPAAWVFVLEGIKWGWEVEVKTLQVVGDSSTKSSARHGVKEKNRSVMQVEEKEKGSGRFSRQKC